MCIASLLSGTQITVAANGLMNLAQTEQEIRPLLSGQVVEREIAGGESHAYQITHQAGQFVRFRLDQRAIDAVLTLTAPDGKKLVEMNLTRSGAHESLSMEVAVAGSYRLIVLANGSDAQVGAYRLEATVTAAATPQDKQRFAAEVLMLEAQQLFNQGVMINRYSKNYSRPSRCGTNWAMPSGLACRCNVARMPITISASLRRRWSALRKPLV